VIRKHLEQLEVVLLVREFRLEGGVRPLECLSRLVEHLQQMEPFVAEMWRRQTPTEWFNYDALHNAFEKTAQKAPPSQKHERRIHSQVRR
jgi:hypothetical protein